MALAVLAANLGVLWVAVEATTIVTAFLVGQRRTRARAGGGVEVRGHLLGRDRAWPCWAPSCSTTPPRTRRHPTGLDWAELTAHAAGLDPGRHPDRGRPAGARIRHQGRAAPLHAWLPDAHSQAPAPVSALMSGVLLSVAFYADPALQGRSPTLALGTGLPRAPC